MKNKVNNEPPAKYEVSRPHDTSGFLDNMSDAELLSRLSPVSIESFRKEMTEKGSLRAVVDDSALLSMSIELTNRYLLEIIKHGDALDSPMTTRNFLKIQLQHEKSEVFGCLWMDNRNRVIDFERMFNGTIDGASVYPREVARSAIAHNAAAVILVHNHPSGVAEPSHADEQITKRLKDALALIDVRTLDHFVVGDEIVSFAEKGLL